MLCTLLTEVSRLTLSMLLVFPVKCGRFPQRRQQQPKVKGREARTSIPSAPGGPLGAAVSFDLG